MYNQGFFSFISIVFLFIPNVQIGFQAVTKHRDCVFREVAYEM